MQFHYVSSESFLFSSKDEFFTKSKNLPFFRMSMVYSVQDIVLTSSAWAGLEEEAPVDEVETVRTSQRGVSRGCHFPEKEARKADR